MSTQGTLNETLTSQKNQVVAAALDPLIYREGAGMKPNPETSILTTRL